MSFNREDGVDLPDTMGSIPTLDLEFMDELLLEGCWLETDDTLMADPSTSCTMLNSTSYDDLVTSGTSSEHLNKNPSQHSLLETERLNFMESSLSTSPLMQNRSNSRWIGPPAEPGPSSSVRERLMKAIAYIKGSGRDRNALIQIWVPVKKGGKQVLTTDDQPFSIDPECNALANFRTVSRKFQFPADEGSTGSVGLPGRVFLGEVPEWTPDVRLFKSEEYPRVAHAWQYEVRGSFALPIFERGKGTCLGVLEVVTTSQKTNYLSELENVCKALEAVNLRSFNISIPPNVKVHNESYRAAIPGVIYVLKSFCKRYNWPLAQTWAPCIQQGKAGCWHSDKNLGYCLSTIDTAFSAADQQVLGFHEACSEHHLLRNQGVAGRASMTNQLFSVTDIAAYSKTEYPLSHHAKMIGLCAAVAIRLRSIHARSFDLILEFFLPPECQGIEEQNHKIDSLRLYLHQASWALRPITDQELEEELMPVKKLIVAADEGVENEEIIEVVPNVPSKEFSSEESSWITQMLEVQSKDKDASTVLSEEFKITSWDKAAVDLHQEEVYNTGTSSSVYGGQDDYSFRKHQASGTKSGEKRRTKMEKTISLHILQQYFAGSLKDAAKSIGVCPTTLKRICRQHGIARWPSRKIKKVDHSLRKLQLVIDSVQGVDGGIQIGSFYNSFPELTSAKSPIDIPFSSEKMGEHSNDSPSNPQPPPCEGSLYSHGGTTRSPSSSCSHSSGSSYCCSTEAKQHSSMATALGRGDTVYTGDTCLILKREEGDAGFQTSKQERELLLRSHNHEPFTEHARLEGLPPLPKSGGHIAGYVSPFKVKATFGEEIIRFSMQEDWSFKDLIQEIKSRFCIEDIRKIDLKYLDDDLEWILMTCDADFEECMDIHKSARTQTIKLSLHQASHLHPKSLRSTCPS